MSWIRTVLREIVGLFIDDLGLAIAVLLWLGLVWLGLHSLRQVFSGGVVLFVGLAAVLVESTLRFSRKRPR